MNFNKFGIVRLFSVVTGSDEEDDDDDDEEISLRAVYNENLGKLLYIYHAYYAFTIYYVKTI